MSQQGLIEVPLRLRFAAREARLACRFRRKLPRVAFDFAAPTSGCAAVVLRLQGRHCSSASSKGLGVMVSARSRSGTSIILLVDGSRDGAWVRRTLELLQHADPDAAQTILVEDSNA
jgi:hypothetical protein